MARPTLPHSVTSRTNQQTSRPGRRPRQRTQRQLARVIAASLGEHREAGQIRCISDFTTCPITIALVTEELANITCEDSRPIQSEANQVTRRAQQAVLDSLGARPLAPIHPCEDCGQRTSYHLYCSACQETRYLWHLWADEEQQAWEQAQGCC